jgi:hypothetical protein
MRRRPVTRLRGVVVSTDLRADRAVVWSQVTTAAGVNDELFPFVRMTVPAAWRRRSILDLEPPAPLGRSWLLAFAVLPFDADDIVITEVGPGFRFVERSTTLTAEAWYHERTVHARPDGCRVEDRVGFRLRRPLGLLPGASWLFGSIVQALFRHRHQRLGASFGSRSAPTVTPWRESVA